MFSEGMYDGSATEADMVSSKMLNEWMIIHLWELYIPFVELDATARQTRQIDSATHILRKFVRPPITLLQDRS